MNPRASNIGDLAARILSTGIWGEVTRVFPRSVYVRSEDDFILLLWGELKSPMTINIEGGNNVGGRIRVGERCGLRRDALELDMGEIDVRNAEMFRSTLLDSRKIVLPNGPALAKGVAMLRSLYDVSPSGPALITDPALKSFVRGTLSPFASGRSTGIYSPARYLPLIGRGGGFTPAGDDFVCGVVGTFNYVARCRKFRQVIIPPALLQSRTIPESATILRYSAKGYFDEGMEKLILGTLDGSGRFYNELMSVAHRGHTSGIDMSLGVLLGEAAMAQSSGEGSALKECIDVLWNL